MKRVALLGALGMVLTLWLVLVDVAPTQAQGGLDVDLTLLSPTEQMVGTAVTWLATPDGVAEAPLYQFRIGLVGEEARVVREFNVYGVLQWMPMVEGTYEVTVAMKDGVDGEPVTATLQYTVLPRVSGEQRAITPAENPLVAMYSRPSCDAGEYVRVRYRAQGALFWQYTLWRACEPGKSFNVYVAGMRANTTYQMQDEVIDQAGVVRSGTLTHKTGTPAVTFPAVTTVDPIDSNTSVTDDVLLLAPWIGTNQLTFPFARDILGRVIWYYPQMGNPWQLWGHLARPVHGGGMLLIVNYLEPVFGLREIDLAGNTLRETNIPAINAQLADLGYPPALSFHHDALRLPNGRTLVLVNSERVLEDVQGTGDVPILGDLILELDEDWQVSWVWDSFEKLDLTREAVLGEECVPIVPDCSGVITNPNTRDWTHSNTIDYVPFDGSLLVSMRNQDWVIKIDYQDGTGSGDVIWRLGVDGDFAIESDDPWPWFSHQHYSRYWAEDELVVFDNGNTRCTVMPQPCLSRGQVYKLDEENMTATLEMNATLHLYAHGWGDGVRLTNGNYHFTYGDASTTETTSLEIRPNGASVFRMDTQAASYRSFRMPSLYVPELNPVAFANFPTLASLPLEGVEAPEQGAVPMFLPFVESGVGVR